MSDTAPDTDEHGRIVVRDVRDIPDFAGEADERAWWEGHTLAAELFVRDAERLEHLPPARRRSRRTN